MTIIVLCFLIGLLIYLTNTNGDSILIKAITLLIGGFLFAGYVARLGILIVPLLLIVGFLIIIIVGSEKLFEFRKDQKINEKDPNLNPYQKLKILERYKRSFTSRKKIY